MLSKQKYCSLIFWYLKKDTWKQRNPQGCSNTLNQKKSCWFKQHFSFRRRWRLWNTTISKKFSESSLTITNDGEKIKSKNNIWVHNRKDSIVQTQLSRMFKMTVECEICDLWSSGVTRVSMGGRSAHPWQLFLGEISSWGEIFAKLGKN